MFDKSGDIKKFGLGQEQTLFSFGIFTIVLAILSFYLFCVIDLVFGSPSLPTSRTTPNSINSSPLRALQKLPLPSNQHPQMQQQPQVPHPQHHMSFSPVSHHLSQNPIDFTPQSHSYNHYYTQTNEF